MFHYRKTSFFRFLVFLGGGVFLIFGQSTQFTAAQQPTGSIPTVTGTPSGPMVKVAVNEQVDVYSGPSFDIYLPIGVLVPGQVVPALGRSDDSSWLEIYYPGVPGNVGWVYAIYMSLVFGNLPSIVTTPFPPTPRITPTINPVLVTALAPEETVIRLSTFTPAQPGTIPTYSSTTDENTSIPIGFVILTLLVIGIFGAIISFLQGR